jgi:hypothetical protein
VETVSVATSTEPVAAPVESATSTSGI